MYFLAIMVPLDGDSRTHVAQAIPLIVQSLGSRSAKLQEQSAEVIKSLVFSAHCHTGNRDSVLAAGAVPSLVQMLRHPGSEKAEHLALKALLALSCEDPDTPEAMSQLTRIRFAKAGAIPPLARLLTSDNSDTKAMALIVLAGLTQNADCCRRAAAAGAVPLLERIVDNNGCEEMQARAEWVLSIIAEQRKVDIQAEALACAATPLATGAEAMTREAGSLPECPAAPSAALITGGELQSSGGTSAMSPVPGTTDSAVSPPRQQQQQPLPDDANRKELCWSCSAEGVRLKKCSR